MASTSVTNVIWKEANNALRDQPQAITASYIHNQCAKKYTKILLLLCMLQIAVATPFSLLQIVDVPPSHCCKLLLPQNYYFYVCMLSKLLQIVVVTPFSLL